MRAEIGFHHSFCTVDTGVSKGLQFQLMYMFRVRLMVAVFRFFSP